MSVFGSDERTRVIDEVGAIERLGQLASDLGAERVFLVTMKRLVEAGHVSRAVSSLEQAGLDVLCFDEAVENPSSVDVERCASVAREFDPDLYVGLGGGSAIDTAKGANFLAICGGRMQDYRGRQTATRPLRPMVAVPTTAGTGSEVQSFALIADAETHQKMACGDPSAAPRIALLDAGLTISQPAVVTAQTGLDALGHALETAVTRARTEESTRYSRSAFVRIVRSLPRVLGDPSAIDARAEMLRAAALAGLAIEHSMLGAAHAMANPLTAHYDVAHGRAVGISLPAVVRYNAGDAYACARYGELARTVGLIGPGADPREGAEALAVEVEHLLDLAGLERRVEGLSRADCARLAGEAATQWTAGFNPRDVGAAELEELFATLVSA